MLQPKPGYTGYNLNYIKFQKITIISTL